MRIHILLGLSFLFAAPAGAQLYKWVDEKGVTHYSDQRPMDAPAARKVEGVANRVSVYSPDKSLLQAVEAARRHSSAPQAPVDHGRVQYGAAVQAPPPLALEACALADCAIVAGAPYPYPTHRRPPHLVQAVLPPGAIAGTVNSNGTIPGNTGSVSNVPPDIVKAGPRMKPQARSHLSEPFRR